MDFIFGYLPLFVPVFIGCLIVIKLTMFFSFKTRNWKLFNLFYFDITHITLSESNKRVSIKKWQNVLTLTIMALIAVEVCLKIFIKSS